MEPTRRAVGAPEHAVRREPVSAVVPTRDRWHLLAETVGSILAQEGVELEVVVVDDNSRKRPPDHPALRDARVRFVRHERSLGVAAARNAGVAAARHPWIAFTDDDDLSAPGRFAAQLDEIARVPGARWSCVGALVVGDSLEPIAHERGPKSGDVSDLLLERNQIPGGASGVLASAELVRSVGGFDERLSNHADYDMWVRLALAAPLACVDRPLVVYRVHAGGLSRHLDEIYDEISYVHEKYATHRLSRGVEPSYLIGYWIGDRHQRSGRRVPAARAYLKARHAVGWFATGKRVVESLVWPGFVRVRDRRRGRRVPSEWLAEVEPWLAAYRSGAVPSAAPAPGGGTTPFAAGPVPRPSDTG